MTPSCFFLISHITRTLFLILLFLLSFTAVSLSLVPLFSLLSLRHSSLPPLIVLFDALSSRSPSGVIFFFLSPSLPSSTVNLSETLMNHENTLTSTNETHLKEIAAPLWRTFRVKCRIDVLCKRWLNIHTCSVLSTCC